MLSRHDDSPALGGHVPPGAGPWAEPADERTRSILDNVADGIITIDEAGTVRTANASAERIFGYATAELIGRDVAELIPESERAAHARSVARFAGEGPGRTVGGDREVRGLRRDGSTFPLELSVAAFTEGGARYFTAVVRDVTDRRRAEDALRAERDFSARVVDRTPAIICGIAADGTTTFLNPAGERITGYRADELIGRHWWRTFYPGDEYHQVERLFRDFERGDVRDYEMVLTTRRGERRTISWNSINRLDPEGRVAEIIGFGDDVTERRAAERALRESRAQLETVVENLDEGLIVSSLDGRLLHWNRAATAMHEWTGADGGLRPLAEYADTFEMSTLDGAVLGVDEWPLSRVLRGEHLREVELRLRRKRGHWSRVFCYGGTLVRDPDGRPLAGFLTITDVTERKQADQALRLYAGRLENLHAIDTAILAARSPSEIAEAALTSLARLVPCWTGAAIAYHFDRGEAEVLGTIGHDPRRPSLALRLPDRTDGHPELESLVRGRVLVIDDIAGADVTCPAVDELRGRGMRSYALLPLMDRGELIGSLLLGSDRPHAYTLDHVATLREVADHLAVALRQALLLRELRAAHARLGGLSRQLLRAQEDERRRIARELHDEIGQALTALKINLQGPGEGGPSAGARLAESLEIVDRTLQQVRGMALDLRPSLLDDLGLVAALEWYVGRHAQRTGLQGRFVADPDEIRAHPEIETACFRVAQEALTNVARHARARRFSVELVQHAAGLQLVVRDDGVGFDPDAALVAAARGASLGLAGMRERVELAGGRIAFVSAPGEGTEVQAEFPNAPTVPPVGPPRPPLGAEE